MLYKFIVLSVLLVLSGCDKPAPEINPEVQDTDFDIVDIDNVSEPSSDGRRTISLTFSVESGVKLKMNAISSFKRLETGYYDIMEIVDERLEAEVSLYFGSLPVTIESGSVYVSRKNDVYNMRWSLMTDHGELTCTFKDKEIPFETDVFAKLLTGGTCTVLRDLTFQSTHLNSTMKYTICFPEGYDENKEYPILYMLHGMDGDNNDWLNNGLDGGVMNAYASEFFKEGGREMIIVSPEGRNLFYVNGYEAGMKYMSYFFEEFIPFIESTYPIRSSRDSRAIGGLSMGGYGTLYYGLLHPEMFCHIYACSAAVYGDGARTPSLDDLMLTASKEERIVDLPGITLEIGTDDFLFSNNESFAKKMDQYEVAYEYITRPGVHYWNFWNECSPKIIRAAAAAFE